MSEKQSSDANIQTFLRIRPSKKPSGFFSIDDMEKNTLMFNLPDNYKSEYINNTKLKHSFNFNGILDMDVSQEQVFNRVGTAAVNNALSGFNSTIFAYGQTGSGKTFTLTGGPEKYGDRGIIPRSISMVFRELRARTDIQFKAYVSYLELYNEQGYDLLDSSETKALEDLPKISIMEDEHGNFHLKNLSMHPAESEEDALHLLFLGETNRAISETPMNLASSRSHCIFTISLEARFVGTDKVRRSKLHLVDLAGSERVSKTNSSGSVLTEAKYINSSLFFLEMVIVALHEKATKGRTHVPYRNSMMTSVLRDSLGGNCRTIMIATINPEAAHTEESLSTCKFAQRVSLIKNKASINEEQDPFQVIKKLKNEVLTLREELAYLKGEAGEGEVLSELEKDTLRQQCRQYCDDPDPLSLLNIGSMTLTKIKSAFAIMKSFVQESWSDRRGTGTSQEVVSGTSSSARNEECEKLEKKVRDLKSLLLQRDSEITILVNMVKQGKTERDVQEIPRPDTGASASSSAMGSTLMGPSTQASGKLRRADSSEMYGAKSAAAVQKEREERLVQRHLFGVPPPPDTSTYEDAAASFEWFRNHCSLTASEKENRQILKDKMEEAKRMGERAQQSRQTIAYLKNSIEAVRRERALQRLNGGEEDGGGENGTGAGLLESPEEVSYRRAIEQEKAVYQESCDRLRILKPEVEHVKKLLEKCRATMQTQFDQWYASLHTKSGVAMVQRAVQESHDSVQARLLASTSTMPMTGAMSAMTSVDTTAMAGSMEGSGRRYGREEKGVGGQVAEAKAAGPGRAPLAASSSSLSTAAASKFTEDDDVNEDIMAFYQAKEELLRRQRQS